MSYADLTGVEFVGVTGQDAVDKLLSERQGHVKSAFCRCDIGGIDLFWGDDIAGLCHIIKERNKRGTDGYKFAESLGAVLKQGTAFPGKIPGSIVLLI